MAVNSWKPNMPRLETVKVPPWNSASCSFPSLALLARSRTVSATWKVKPNCWWRHYQCYRYYYAVPTSISDFPGTSVTMGVMRPESVATATETSMLGMIWGKEMRESLAAEWPLIDTERCNNDLEVLPLDVEIHLGAVLERGPHRLDHQVIDGDLRDRRSALMMWRSLLT